MGEIIKKRSHLSKFKDSYVELAYRYARTGLTDILIAKKFKVSVNTYYVWCRTKEDFRAAVDLGKHEYDMQVEKALLRRSKGYTVKEEKVFFNPKEDTITRTTVKKHIPADTNAAIFWLKNRQKERWKDRVEQVHEVGSNTKNFLESLVNKSLESTPKTIEVESESIEDAVLVDTDSTEEIEQVQSTRETIIIDKDLEPGDEYIEASSPYVVLTNYDNQANRLDKPE